MRTVKIAPSILAADFANLAAERRARRAPKSSCSTSTAWTGTTSPTSTIGPPVVAALRPHTDLFLDCHLMVDNPGRLLRAFADAGADGLTVHVELGDPRPLLTEIAALGVRRGLAFEPETPFEAVEPYLGDIDLLLVMSVHTGFGGQPFIAEVLDKVRAARKVIDERRRRGRDRDRRRHQGRQRRGSRPRPASTSSCRARASSAPTIPPRPRAAIRAAAS